MSDKDDVAHSSNITLFSYIKDKFLPLMAKWKCLKRLYELKSVGIKNNTGLFLKVCNIRLLNWLTDKIKI